jgi:peptide/nickel transport system substrate-binding protein
VVVPTSLAVYPTAFVRWIDRVEKVGPHKVRIIAKQSFPAAVAYLASPRLAIFPHEYYARVGPRGMNERPIGTGPYRVVEHARGKYVRLERNAEYFKASPKVEPQIDKVEIRFIPDRQTQVAEAVAGGLDLVMDVGRDQAEQLRTVRGLDILSVDTTGYSYLRFNTMPNTPAPPLRDVRVRRAIMYAIDREAIVKYIIGDLAKVIHTECYPGQSGCTDEGVPRYNYDPGKARQLLVEAGFSGSIDVDLYAANSASGNRNELEAIVGYLRAVGINARLHVLQIDAILSAVRTGRVSLLVLGTTNPIDDVSASFGQRYEFAPLDMNRDEEVNGLLARGNSSLDPAVRSDAYTRAFKTIAERAYVLPLHSVPNFYIAAEGLVFEPRTDDIPRFYEMSWK